MAAKPPDAFLSYTRFDDHHDGGAISEFRRRLANAVRAVSGVPFEIFQDVDGIALGEHWPGKLDRLLDEVRFFIPILTPSYFTSKACRDELEKFLRGEAERGRNDLVLPIYYIEWMSSKRTSYARQTSWRAQSMSDSARTGANCVSSHSLPAARVEHWSA
jgi:hypothetical protein